MTDRQLTIYRFCYPCIDLDVPSGITEPLSYLGDPVVSKGLFEELAPRSFIDERVHLQELPTASRNLKDVGTFQCQLIYDDHVVNDIAHGLGWTAVSQAGRVLGPLVTIRVGWFGTSIVGLENE